jgi:hypothetical protein
MSLRGQVRSSLWILEQLKILTLSNEDVRTSAIAFLLPFLSAETPVSLKSDVLATKGIVPGILRGLPDDPLPVIDAILEQIWWGVLKDTALDARTKASVLAAVWEPVGLNMT